ncbi:cation:proton antiporter [Candidatus Nanosalina sp. VS9-1]|uniref:cation:proton antiporter domain-containing protein n=1 Tax=Candidatus Nanosalina sp. VS9-1 TaxID=3388566 RepID=UPI0039E002F0
MVFVASSIVLFLFDRFSHPALPAYIIAGVIVGNFFPADEMINFTQIGLSFLVFIFGVKMDPERLKSVAGDGLKTAAVQITAVSVLAVGLSMIMNLSGFETLVFVLATALSSTLVGLDLLEKEIDLKLAHGRLAESIHLSQDLIAVMFLMILGASAFTFEAVSQSFIHGFGVLALALLFRKYALDHLADLTENSRELLMLVSITILIGFLGLTEYFQISLAIGSFAAGLAVSKYPHNMEILDTTGSLKDFFSAIFFVSLGALLTVPTPQVLIMSAVMLVLTVIGKPFAVITSLVALGQNKRTAYLTGFSIDQVSEFALIITIQAYISGLIGGTVFQAVIITATVSMMISSYTAKHGDRIYNLLSEHDHIEAFGDKEERSKHNLEDHVIVVGHDTQGKRIIETLRDEEKEYIVIDNDPEKVTDLKEKGENFVFGDVMEIDTWERADYREACLIISTVPLEKTSRKILSLPTDADKILRSEDIEEAEKLLEDGAIYVNVPEVLSAELLPDHIEGLMENRRYREDLRRRNMLEVRKYLQNLEG